LPIVIFNVIFHLASIDFSAISRIFFFLNAAQIVNLLDDL